MQTDQLFLNLGGEGEIPGVLNQQPEWAAAGVSVYRVPFANLIASGDAFLFCSNLNIALPNGSVDRIDTNNVRIDAVTWRGSGVQSSEIVRLLRSGGRWFNNGALAFTKP